jgi:hypothetical protein
VVQKRRKTSAGALQSPETTRHGSVLGRLAASVFAEARAAAKTRYKE